MNKFFAILSVFVLLAFSSCRKDVGETITKEFNIEGTYTKLEVHNAFDVTMSDAVSQITVTVGENIMPKVIVEKVGDKLKIRLKPFTFSNGSPLKVVLPYNADLTSVDLSGASEYHSNFMLTGTKVEVDLSGASEFYCDINAADASIELSGASDFHGDFYGEDLEIDLSGSSNIEGWISASELDLCMSGASDATFNGFASTLKIDLSGASNIVEKVITNKYAFACDKCKGQMSGSSDAYIHCNNSIRVDLSGASELHYTGDADTNGSTCTGGSNIIHHVE